MNDIIRIPNINKYTLEIINEELILTLKKQYITEGELDMKKIKKENEIISINNTYRSILIDIWKYMPSQKILQTSTFNFKLTKENSKNGYNWCKDIHMSFQNKDSTNTLKEIINMVKVNKLSMNLSIKLKTGENIHLKIE